MKTTTAKPGLIVRSVCGAFLLWSGGARAAGVQMAQEVSLQDGWNAVYLSVTPDESADETFASWPVESVGKYNPAPYLETKQFSGSGTTEGTVNSSFALWKRGEPALSQFDRVAANNVYVCYATNSWSGTIYGEPASPRLTWHPTSTNTPYNYVGISIVPGTTTTYGQYFDGLDVGNATFLKVYHPYGANPDALSLGLVSASEPLTDGSVVVMSASLVSDWSGVLNVSPMDGVDFSTNLTQISITVRNDGAAARTMRLALASAKTKPGDGEPALLTGLKLRDTSVYTNAWRDFGPERPFDRPLAAKETVTIMLALDRTQLTKGDYGGLLHLLDLDGGSNFRATMPVEASSVVDDEKANAWPAGLWLASGEFDTVTTYDRIGKGDDVEAGGKMNVRLPLYVDDKGKMSLLSRFVFGADALGETHVYSGAVEKDFPVPIGDVKRVTSAVLPIDQPVLPASEGAFGETATFAFVVGQTSRVNPMRHAYHPSHDGLRWDFKTPAPDGDDMGNYVSTVKPETFSISNRIVFTWNSLSGNAWCPEETLTGHLLWELGGVRKEGPVRMSGSFVMKRIAQAILDK